MRSTSDLRLAVIGLGYVGLPLAVEFAKTRPVVGFDINEHRIAALARRRDVTRELSPEELAQGKMLQFSTKPADIADCNFYIVTVPTPVDDDKQPDLGPVLSASATIGKVLKKGDIVVYEVDRLSRRDRRGLRAGAGEDLRAEVQRRFLRRLQPRAHQSRRQGATRRHDQEDHLGLDAGSRRPRRRALQRDRHRRHAQGAEHQGRRGRQGDREHAARPQHRHRQRIRA